MIEVKVTKEVNVSADAVWAEVALFSGIENYSPIAKSVVTGSGEGAKRTCTMPDGAQIHEELTVLNSADKYMEYTILESPLPITNYTGKVKVVSTGADSCEISWGSTYNVGPEAAAQMEEMLTGIYNAIISGLEELVSANA